MTPLYQASKPGRPTLHSGSHGSPRRIHHRVACAIRFVPACINRTECIHAAITTAILYDDFVRALFGWMLPSGGFVCAFFSLGYSTGGLVRALFPPGPPSYRAVIVNSCQAHWRECCLHHDARYQTGEESFRSPTTDLAPHGSLIQYNGAIVVQRELNDRPDCQRPEIFMPPII
jgi:hypothetical protein